MLFVHAQSTPAHHRRCRRFAVVALTVAGLATVIPAAAASPAGVDSAPHASAHHNHTSHHAPRSSHSSRSKAAPETARAEFAAKADAVIKEAKKQKGKPYVYGADGPGAFDCSGLVRYVFMNALHVSLPHNAAEQYGVSHHIKRSELRVGDLVFVDNGGYVSHVGIYDGHGYWWVAPHTGTRVQRQKIYAAHFVYGRVIHWPGSPRG